jgi:hypothetical protein
MRQTKLAPFAAALVLALPAFAAPAVPGQGQAIVTLLPKQASLNSLQVQPQDLQLKVDGKSPSITGIISAKDPRSPVELVLLIDAGARGSLGTQLSDITGFIKEIPGNTKMTIAYMANGRAEFAGQLSSDPNVILRGLRLPGGPPGIDASPYFCLSDLAKNWPSHDPNARREVVMVSDGVDYYNLHYDPNDPYVLNSIDDAVRSGLVVYSIYWLNRGRLDNTGYENNAGQNLLQEVTQATGGYSYWEGTGDPVSFQPFFKDLRRRLENQFKIAFSSELRGKPQSVRFTMKLHGIDAKVSAPQQVFLNRAAGE